MSVSLDPIPPWARLYEVARALPAPLVVLGVIVGLSGLAVPLLAARARGAARYGAVAALMAPLLLLAWHAWPFARDDAREAAGSAAAPLVAVAWLGGMALLLMGPAALAGLSLVGYANAPGATPAKRRVVAGLRLAAFALALLAVARPSWRVALTEQADAVVLVLLDRSRSMTIQDEQGKRSRWEHALRQIADCAPFVERLRSERQIEVRWYGFGEELAPLSLAEPGEANGRRTAIGAALRALYDARPAGAKVRGVLLISDGAENGAVPVLAEAARWRLAPASVHTFACGNPATTIKQNDVAITSLSTTPSPFVPVKGKLTVKATIDARGYASAKARVRLFLEMPDEKGVVSDREVTAQDVRLDQETGNEVELTADAPARPGEVKVKVVVETGEPDNFPLNNVSETFVTVSKEGISVLLVDRQRAFEPQLICDALSEDLRFRVTPVWLRGGQAVRGGGAALVSFDEQPFDVIILGDVTLDQLRGLDPQITEKIEKQVARGAGLMALGGYVNLGAGRWGDDEKLRGLLPVDLGGDHGQQERPTRLVPTKKGLDAAPYILRLGEGADVAAAWKKLASLDGYTVLKLRPAAEGKEDEKGRRTTEEVLARAEAAGGEAGDPLLVMKTYAGAEGRGNDLARVLVFGGDTTYRWVRDEDGQALHRRFWKQVVVWLARQENAEGTVWVRPDVRRLPAGGEITFSMGLRGSGGGPEVKGGTYQVEVIAPDGTKKVVKGLRQGGGETRGAFGETREPGVYQVVVRGEGADPSGGKVSGEARARVIVYDHDKELQPDPSDSTRNPAAADPKFLKAVADEGKGEARRVEELASFFARLAEQPEGAGVEAGELRPDWNTRERSPFLVAFFVAFVALVSLEWGLRRKWGMV